MAKLEPHPNFDVIDESTPGAAWKSGLARLKDYRFWRNCIIYFCLFSIVGHWFEYIYCMFNDYFFHIVDPNSGVWNDPNYPFFVYGFGVVICAAFLVPYRSVLKAWRTYPADACIHFFLIGVFIAMGMELSQGFLQNQPDEFGNYPLWDNSQLPGNIFGQAWIVNDVMISLIMTLFTWVFYPALERFFSRFSDRTMNIAAVVVVVLMTILTIYEYTTFG